jgi:hypothetical protein
MPHIQQANTILKESVDEINQLEGEECIIFSPETKLLGSESLIDSLVLVRLLVTVEAMIEEQSGRVIAIVDESTFEMDGESPFSTIGSLADHIANFLRK